MRAGKILILIPTLEPRFDEPPYNEVLGITNVIFFTLTKVTVKCMEQDLRLINEPRYNEILFITVTNTIEKPKLPRLTNKCDHATKDECETA